MCNSVSAPRAVAVWAAANTARSNDAVSRLHSPSRSHSRYATPTATHSRQTLSTRTVCHRACRVEPFFSLNRQAGQTHMLRRGNADRFPNDGSVGHTAPRYDIAGHCNTHWALRSHVPAAAGELQRRHGVVPAARRRRTPIWNLETTWSGSFSHLAACVTAFPRNVPSCACIARLQTARDHHETVR